MKERYKMKDWRCVAKRRKRKRMKRERERERKKRSRWVSDKIQQARSDSSLLLPLPFLFLSVTPLDCARPSFSSFSRTAFALVPSPRPLAGACFFPTRSSGIPPLLTAACFSRPRTDANPLLGDVPLQSSFDSTIDVSQEGMSNCRKLHCSLLS